MYYLVFLHIPLTAGFFFKMYIKILEATPDCIRVNCFPPNIYDLSFPNSFLHDHLGSNPNLVNLRLFYIFNKWQMILICEILCVKFVNKYSASECWDFKLHPVSTPSSQTWSSSKSILKSLLKNTDTLVFLPNQIIQLVLCT